MNLSMRPYRDEEDYWRLREFLRRVFLANNLRQWSWHVARLDYWWWFIQPDLIKSSLEENVFLWETESGQIAAAIIVEGRGQVYPQFDPAWKTPALEAELAAVAEQCAARAGEDGRKKVWVFTDANDRPFHDVLAARGFHRVVEPGETEIQHRRLLDAPIPAAEPVPGYTIRALGTGLELLERAYASGLGFHDDDIQTARSNRDDPAWYHHIQAAPLYRRDLDLVAAADDGSIASFCTVWFDDVTRSAIFEPVATVPAHRRHGLGRALLLEGLRRLKGMGCRVAFVGGYSEAANGLYFSVMGPDYDRNEPWEKER